MLPTFDEFAEMLDQEINRIPPRFCANLTGGFNIEESEKRKEEFYVLGEYTRGGHLGCFIVFYYGSFVSVMRKKSRQAWETQIRETVLHEMQHHMEAEAGRNDLARKEMEEWARFMHDKQN
jgi:hypothetical protein